MKNILALENRAILEQFVSDDSLIAFDYDGTLAPIVPDPDQARMRESTRELLWELAQLSRVIVISGKGTARRAPGMLGTTRHARTGGAYPSGIRTLDLLAERSR